MKIQNKKPFPFNFLRTELDHFLYKNGELKKQSLNLQLAKAVEAGVMSYSDMVQFRDRANASEKSIQKTSLPF